MKAVVIIRKEQGGAMALQEVPDSQTPAGRTFD